MSMTRLAQFGAAAVIGAMALTACTPTKQDPGNDSGSAQPTAVFKYLMTANPTTFDPIMITDVPTQQIIHNVYSGLVEFNEKGEVIKDMAATYKISDDGKTYTFTLKDAKFHDGSKVKAEDFKRSMLRAMNPANASPVADSYLDDIAGYATFLGKQSSISQRVKDNKLSKDDAAKEIDVAYQDLVKDSGIEAKDEKTLTIRIDEPKAYFLAKLTYPTAYVVHKSMPADKPLTASPDNVSKMIGTGPFKGDSYVDHSKFIMKRFADFYGEKAKVGTVEMPIIEAEQSQLAAYRSNQNQVSLIPPTDYAAVKRDASLSKEIVEWASARVNYFALNQGKLEAAKDPRVRQAINHAIDKEKLNEIVFSSTQSPAYGVLPDSIPGSLGSKVEKLGFDPAKAKQLLKDAGYGEGAKQLKFTITYRAKQESSERLAQYIQDQLKKNAGITVDVAPMEWGALLAATQKKTELESFLLGWSADYIDPQDFLTILLRTGAPYNRYGYSNKEFDTIIDKADRMAPGTTRFAEYSKAEQISVKDAAWVPTTFAKSLYLVKPEVKGFRYNAMGVMPLNTVTISK